MNGRQIVLGRIFGRDAAALMQDGQLADLIIDPSGLTPLTPGAICRARVDRLVKGQGGVFLRLPEGAKGFLRDRNGLREGQSILVQITGVPEDGKAIPVTSRLLLRGRHLIVSLGAPGVNVSRKLRDPEQRDMLVAMGEKAIAGLEFPPGIIFRSAAISTDPAEITQQLAELVELAEALRADAEGLPELLLDAQEPAETAWQEWGEQEGDAVDDGDDAFPLSGAEDAVMSLLGARTDLGGGAWAEIGALRALVAIDVNTGSDHSAAAGLRANIALARDLARQLRLRGLGGQIVIDFAPMPKRERGTVEQILRAAFRAESSETVLIGWTAMGLYELSRKRDRVPLARLAASAPAST